jgi:hypothetical protein
MVAGTCERKSHCEDERHLDLQTSDYDLLSIICTVAAGPAVAQGVNLLVNVYTGLDLEAPAQLRRLQPYSSDNGRSKPVIGVKQTWFSGFF